MISGVCLQHARDHLNMFAHKWNHECNNSNEMLLKRKNNIRIFIHHAVNTLLVIKLYYLAHLNYKLSRKCSNKFYITTTLDFYANYSKQNKGFNGII